MPAKKKSYKGKGEFLTYQNENRAKKNKIAKLQRHISKFPNDDQAQKALVNLSAGAAYTGRVQPKRKAPWRFDVVGQVKGERTTSLISTMNNRITREGRDLLHLQHVFKALDNESRYQKGA